MGSLSKLQRTGVLIRLRNNRQCTVDVLCAAGHTKELANAQDFASASVITSKAANSYQFKTGQRKWPSRTEIVLPCRLLWWQVGFGAPAPRAALEHVPVV